MKRILTIIAVILLTASAAYAQQTPNYEQAARFSQKKIAQMVFSTSVTPNWFKNSDKFWYSWSSPDGTFYYIVDPANGTKTPVFDMDKLAMQLTQIIRDPFDAQHIPIQGLKLKDDKVFRFDIKSTIDVPDTSDVKDAAKAPAQNDKSAKPKSPKMTKKVFHFEYDITSGKLSEYKPEKEEYPRFVSISPDGQIGVFARNRNLFWMDKENMAKALKDEKDSTIVEHRLTSDGKTNFGYGTDSYSGDTQQKDTMKRSNPGRLAWSPDSKYFAVIKSDMTAVKDFWVINSLSNPRPTLETYKYQMPGEPGPKQYLYLFNVQDGTSKHIKTNAFKDQTLSFEMADRKSSEAYEKFRSSKWLGDNTGFYVSRVSRDLKRMDYCWVAVDSDSTKTIVSERMNTYIEGRNLRMLEGGKKFLEWSERNGWANLYLYNSDGTLIRNITEGAYHVDAILGVNEKEGYVLFSASGVNKGENPYQMHNYRVSLQGGPIKQLDMDDMSVLATSSDDGKYLVANASRVDCAPTCWLIDAAGKRTHLEDADLSKLYEAGYKMPERFTVKAADGVTDLYGTIYKPYDFDPEKVYPIIDYVYPGPQQEGNFIEWSKNMLRTDRLAQLGFVVITVGNRGGHPDRSKWYHNYGYGNLRDYGLEDQKVAVQRLAAKYPWINEKKVGIMGHSGGGFMSTAAILTYPDFYTAAVSCSGNHDNSIYNRWWSEKHHGIQEKVNEQNDTTFVYHIETNQELAENLKGHLMLVTGDIDNNVNPANTIRVVNALIKANKRFDFVLLPGQRHAYGDMFEYFFYRMADYFAEWLMEDSDRSVVDIAQLNND